MKPDLSMQVLTDHGIGKITRISGRAVTVAGTGWVEFHVFDNFESHWKREELHFDMRGVI